MRHKQDAIKQANEIISKFINSGVYSIGEAKKYAEITIETVISNIRYGTMEHSLFTRALNFLKTHSGQELYFVNVLNWTEKEILIHRQQKEEIKKEWVEKYGHMDKDDINDILSTLQEEYK